MGRESSPGLKWSLRAVSGISFVIGMGYVIWALVLQNPPKSALPIGLLVIGVIAMVAALMGLFHSMCARCCLTVFFSLIGLLCVAELAVVIALFANLDGNVNNLLDYSIGQDAAASQNKKVKPPKTRRLFQATTDTTSSLTPDELATQQSIKTSLEIGRYVFLVLVILQFIALMVTIVMRVRSPYVDESLDFEEQKAARSAMAQIQMESLKKSVSSGNKTATSPLPEGSMYSSSGKMSKTVSKKMSQKYGEFTQDPSFQKKWWQR